MVPPLIDTKLCIPPSRPRAVLRERLIDRIQEGLYRKLTLISASAGYGKTTLAGQWLSREKRPAAWLSLDEGDNAPHRFLTYLFAALRTIEAKLGEGAAKLLHAPQPPPLAAIITVLIQDLIKFPEKFVVVLDDYHVIHSPGVDEAISLLLDYMPPNMHMVILTREEPNLPLARLRVNGEVTDLGAPDLRFHTAEAAGFLTDVMRLKLSSEAVSAVEIRTEGWIAGLQIAALSMTGHSGAAQPVPAFQDSPRLLMDYLMEEVLSKQSASVQKFLLYTSILGRFCGSLCDAVMLHEARVPGDQMLRDLERANLFIVPLDREQRWYRHHALFAELLRKQFKRRMPASADGVEEAELHERASRWYASRGFAMEAFRHAAAAGNHKLAARLALGDGMPLHLRGEVLPVLDWLESLTEAELADNPPLWVIYGSALLLAGRPTEIEPKLQAAEAAMPGPGTDTRTDGLIGLIAATRAAVASIGITGQPVSAKPRLLAAEDALRRTEADDKTHDLVELILPAHAASSPEPELLDTVIALSRRAAAYLKPAMHPVRQTMLWLMGVAYQLRGDRAEAMEAYAGCLAMGGKKDGTILDMMASVGLGGLLEADNRLFEAEECYASALLWLGDLPVRAACEAHLGLARISYERNDLEDARRHAQQSEHVARQLASGDSLVMCEMLAARLKAAESDWVPASVHTANAVRIARTHGLWHRLPQIADIQALALLRRGDAADALHVARKHGLSLTEARAHLALGDTPAALSLLEPLRKRAEARGWADERLKAMILQAAALYAHGDRTGAVRLLLEALEPAEESGLLRTLIDEGPVLIPVLKEAAVAGRLRAYMGILLDSYTEEKKREEVQAYPWIEPLSSRELEVLRLIAQGLSNREIGEKLFLSLDTVKGHNRRIFDKLQVHRRTEAVALARKLGWTD
ncbi:LuxR family transcriptional regulator, maltose regulon positive regulatory protein [Paenibacillus sp. UNCCL117]|uniref:LuxR C-terminal-related transcriptional regulator n=1 Tax=unclassified Paenibacillus TaxID=185978 RepID=UPI00088C5041|nr:MULTISPECIES: LuxR C-terminal-related transcriptional regulator [unclassified Paenibacillus]SDC12784.1 LuxR family transcriptional regulator, maltose regulon positive regulatory protein [Paenibacillus sp. cl123]SFW16896.1 LuxR family transcriptional regulator, maltose regulon positive regulatory protein [Paenibacillus sp. UNCCL117]